jgi:hypothetical protein
VGALVTGHAVRTPPEWPSWYGTKALFDHARSAGQVATPLPMTAATPTAPWRRTSRSRCPFIVGIVITGNFGRHIATTEIGWLTRP